MNKLNRVIGNAPSEMTLDELRIKLTIERTRVRNGLNYFKNVTLRQSGKRVKKATHATKLKALMSETGLSPKEVLKAIELLKKQKQNSPESEGAK